MEDEEISLRGGSLEDSHDDSREEGEISGVNDEEAALLEKLIGESDRLDPTTSVPPIVASTSVEQPTLDPKMGYKFLTEEKSVCLVCNKKCARRDALKRHWDSKHEKEVMLFDCPECKRQMIRKEDMIHHGSTIHKWSEEQKAKNRKVQGRVGINKWYKSPKGKSGPSEVRKMKIVKKNKVFQILSIPSPINFPTSVSTVSNMPLPLPIPSPPSPPVVQHDTEEAVKVVHGYKIPDHLLSPGPVYVSTPRMPPRIPVASKTVWGREKKELPLPPSVPTTVDECKKRIREAIGKRELAIRQVDELHTVEKRLRLQEVDCSELEREKQRRRVAEEKVEELMRENKKLKEIIQGFLA